MKKIYHLCLSSHDEVLFRSEADLIRGFNSLALASLTTDSNLLADGLLTTHLHQLVQTDSPLETIFRMRYSYARYFNTKYKRKGKLGERKPYCLEVEGYHHTLAALNYVNRQGLHHGLSPSPFGYPYCSSNAFFRKLLGKEIDKPLLPTIQRYKYLPEGVSLPERYRMDNSGLLLREDIIDTALVETYYVSSRNYLFQMNKIGDEISRKEQQEERSSSPVITLELIEKGVPDMDIEQLLRNESGKHNYVLYTEAADAAFAHARKAWPVCQRWSTADIGNTAKTSTFYTQERYVCHAALTGLAADTRYLFKIVSDGEESDVRSFRTAGATGPWNFVAFTDFQHRENPVTLPLIQMMKELAGDPALMLCSGDQVDVAGNEYEWTFLLDNDIFRDFVYAAAPGDHAYWASDKVDGHYPQYDFAYTFNHLFRFPENGAPASRNTTYWFHYNNVLFVSLDMNNSDTATGARFNDQVRWFSETLDRLAGTYQYLVVFEHKSIFGSEIVDSVVARRLRPQWYPVFQKYRVDLVLSGHDHIYSRTFALDGDQVTTDPDAGTFYLDMGSSGDKRRPLDASLTGSPRHAKVMDLKELGQSCAANIFFGGITGKIPGQAGNDRGRQAGNDAGCHARPRPGISLDILRRQILRLAQNDSLFNHILQLADIPAPSLRLQDLRGFGFNPRQGPVILFGKTLQEQLGQRHDVLFAFPERRQGDVDGVDAVVEVLAEPSLPDQCRQIHIGRADQPDVHRNRLCAAHPYHAPVLDDPQQLGLQVQRDVADFIQEQRPAVGLLELAYVIGMRIGESALHMAEQFAFKQRLRDGAGIHRHHRLPVPEAVGVDLVREHILAGTVLAGDQHGRIGRGDLVECFADVGHGFGSAPEHHGRPRPGIPAQRPAGLIPSRGQHFNELVIVPRLHDEIEGPALHPFHGQLDVGIRRKQHNLHLRHHLLDLPGPVQALVSGVDRRVEIHVQQHHVRPELLQRVHQCRRRRDGLHLGKVHGQQDFQRPADAQVIIDHQYFPNFRSHCQIYFLNSSMTVRRARTSSVLPDGSDFPPFNS